MDEKQRQRVIRELNRFLQGRYMGIHQYEYLISHAKEPKVRELLQEFQQHAKLGAQKIAKRIQDLGGQAVDGVGVMGELREWMQTFREPPQNSRDILHDALLGENKYGIHFSHRMVAGDLDEESKRIVDTVLEEDQKRVDQLKKQLQLLPTS
ncbi:ferritin-like domain-containing protein [Brevibacillus sp. NL20B1]|jgi:bacterioferritin|uniref:ferritin-like domain-containing protein n=1 Tax=Brevibacillus sp. NL20B1 TaxID=2829799 RepID=UPI001B957F7B|nr:ferritin-like domain-containing protein [Brevibacillus sp. NL20B1]MBR8660951.1 ferritin-like domain-containing protein [Brevibacillus sp. NL20B1]